MNKKGVSAVVATVLIIMITVAAVGILWATVVPMIKNNVAQGTACFDAQTDVSLIAEGYTCAWAGTTEGKIAVQVSKGNNDKVLLAGLKAIVMKDGNSFSFDIPTADLGNGVTKVFNVTGTTAKNIADADSVQIAPIIKTGQTNKTCEPVAAPVMLTAC